MTFRKYVVHVTASQLYDTTRKSPNATYVLEINLNIHVCGDNDIKKARNEIDKAAIKSSKPYFCQNHRQYVSHVIAAPFRRSRRDRCGADGEEREA